MSRLSDKPADYCVDEGDQLIWKEHLEGNNAEYVYMGTALSTAWFTQKVLNIYNSSQSGNLYGVPKPGSNPLHSFMKSLSDPDTGVVSGFGAVIYDGGFYDVGTPEDRDSAEAYLMSRSDLGL